MKSSYLLRSSEIFEQNMGNEKKKPKLKKNFISDKVAINYNFSLADDLRAYADDT